MIYHVRAVRRGAPHTLVVGDMPFMSYQVSPEQAGLRGEDAQGGRGRLRQDGGRPLAGPHPAAAGGGGHPRDRPHRADAAILLGAGAFRQGRTPEQAEALIADAQALDEAGVFAMVLECIPAGLAKVITAAVRATTILVRGRAAP